MFEAHVNENAETGICEIEFITDTARFTVHEDKINVTDRITKELLKIGY